MLSNALSWLRQALTRSTVLWWLAALIVGGVAVLAFLRTFGDRGFPMDEGSLLVFPERVLAGAVANRDFYSLYGPGNNWVLAATYAIFGVDYSVERVVGLVYRLAIVIGILALAWRSNRALAVMCALLAIAVLMPLGVPALAWFGGIALLLWSVWSLTAIPRSNRGRRWFPIVAGLLGGLAVTYRPDLAIGVFLIGASAARWMRRDLRFFLVGLLAGLMPLSVHVLVAGPGPFVQNVLIDELKARAGRGLPLPPSDPGELHAFATVVFAGVLGVIATGLALIRGRPQTPFDRTVAGVGALVVGVLYQLVQRDDIYHIVLVGCVAVPFVPLFALSLVTRRRAAYQHGLLPLALGVGLVIALGLSAPEVTNSSLDKVLSESPPTAALVSSGDRSFPVYQSDSMAVTDVLRDLQRLATPPGGRRRLFVGPHQLSRSVYADVYLYYLSPEFVPSSYYQEIDPGVANAPGSRLATDLASSDIVVLNSYLDGWNEPNASALELPGGTAAQAVLDAQFCVSTKHGYYLVLVRCH